MTTKAGEGQAGISFTSLACPLHLVPPSHPLLALLALNFAGCGAVVGHIGYDRTVVAEGISMATRHGQPPPPPPLRRRVRSEGLLPFDRLFGTCHGGRAAGDAAMRSRLRAWRDRAARAR